MPDAPLTTKELVRLANIEASACALGGQTATALILRQLAARLEALEGIVEKLPKTADGVTIGLGDNFYFVQDSEVVRAGVVGLTRAVIDSDAYVDHVSYHDEDGCEDGLPSGSCYSTKDAAEAARARGRVMHKCPVCETENDADKEHDCGPVVPGNAQQESRP